MGKGGAGVVWASARGLLRGPSSIGLGPHLAFKLYKLAQGGLSLRTPCLFALWCTAMFTFVGLALDHAGRRAVSCELGLKETTGPTGGTQKGELGWPH